MALPGIYKCFQHWGEKNGVFITSDTHFGDEELKAGIPGRPSDEELVKMINSTVGRTGTLIHLGDVGDIKTMKKIRGYKILICGNHDAGKTNYEEVFDEIYTGALIIGEKIILSHEPLPGITWAMNIHGHDHTANGNQDKFHTNACLDASGYKLISLNQFLKNGATSKIQTIHRTTINKASKRKGDKAKCQK